MSPEIDFDDQSNYTDADVLEELYINHDWSSGRIAERFGVKKHQVEWQLEKYQIRKGESGKLHGLSKMLDEMSVDEFDELTGTGGAKA